MYYRKALGQFIERLQFIEQQFIEQQFIERQCIEPKVYRNDLSDTTVERQFYGMVTTLQCTAAVITVYLILSKCKVRFYLSLVSTGS